MDYITKLSNALEKLFWISRIHMLNFFHTEVKSVIVLKKWRIIIWKNELL